MKHIIAQISWQICEIFITIKYKVYIIKFIEKSARFNLSNKSLFRLSTKRFYSWESENKVFSCAEKIIPDALNQFWKLH